MIRKITIGLLGLGLSAFAFAASNNSYVAPPAARNAYSPGIYVGLQAGYGMTGWDNVENAVASNNPKVSGENAFAGRAYVGYDFHPNFAVEAGYTQFFNDTKIKTNTNVVISNPEYNYVVDVVGKLKACILQNFGLYAKAGVDYMATNEGVDKKRHDAFNVVYGAGAFYNITRSFSMDLAWTRFNGDANWNKDYIPAADLFTLGASWKFNFS